MVVRGGRGAFALLVVGAMLLAGCATPRPGATSGPAAPPTPPPTAAPTDPAADPGASPPAAPEPSPTPTCGALDAAAAAGAAIVQLPPPFEQSYMADRGWDLGTADLDGYDPCSDLSWIVFTVSGGTGSSPSQIALFHRGDFLGPATERAYGFWPDVVRLSDRDIEVTYRWPQQGEGNAQASGRSVSWFTWDDAAAAVSRSGELPPIP